MLIEIRLNGLIIKYFVNNEFSIKIKNDVYKYKRKYIVINIG